MHDHDGLKYVLRAGTVDTLADVFLRTDRFPCRYFIPEGHLKSEEDPAVYLRILKRDLYLRRHHESGQHPDELWPDHMEEPDRLLHFRYPGGSGAGDIDSFFPLDIEPTVTGKAGTYQEEVRADRKIEKAIRSNIKL